VLANEFGRILLFSGISRFLFSHNFYRIPANPPVKKQRLKVNLQANNDSAEKQTSGQSGKEEKNAK